MHPSPAGGSLSFIRINGISLAYLLLQAYYLYVFHDLFRVILDNCYIVYGLEILFCPSQAEHSGHFRILKAYPV